MFCLWMYRSFWSPTAPMPSATAVMNLATLQRTAPMRFLPQEPMYPPGRDRLHATNYDPRHGRHFIPTAIPIVTEAAVSESTPFAPHPATAAAHITLCAWWMPPSWLTTSLTGITHATPQTEDGLTSETPTTLHTKHSQEKPSYIQILQLPINSTVLGLSPSGFPFRFFIRFIHWLWSFKLLEPSPSSDEDEWGGHSSNTHYTIGLVSDWPHSNNVCKEKIQGSDWLWSSSLISPYQHIQYDWGPL